MNHHNPILSKNLNKIIKNRQTLNIRLRAVIYFISMLWAGAYYYGVLEHEDKTLWIGFSSSLFFIFLCTSLSFILEIFRWYKRTENEADTAPFWFQVLEGAFGIWILLGTFFLLT